MLSVHVGLGLFSVLKKREKNQPLHPVMAHLMNVKCNLCNLTCSVLFGCHCSQAAPVSLMVTCVFRRFH